MTKRTQIEPQASQVEAPVTTKIEDDHHKINDANEILGGVVPPVQAAQASSINETDAKKINKKKPLFVAYSGLPKLGKPQRQPRKKITQIPYHDTDEGDEIEIPT